MTPELALDAPAGEQQGQPDLEADTLELVDRRSAEQAVVAVVGLGYVGLPTAIALRGAGAHIIGIDVSARRLEQIREGRAELLSSEQDALRAHL